MKKVLTGIAIFAWWASGLTGWLYWLSCIQAVGVVDLIPAAVEGFAGPTQWAIGYYAFGPGKLPNIIILHKRDCCKAK